MSLGDVAMVQTTRGRSSTMPRVTTQIARHLMDGVKPEHLHAAEEAASSVPERASRLEGPPHARGAR
jgi:hypothetical protein